MRAKRTLLLMVLATGCGGASHNESVQEVPIEQGGGHNSSELPPDEVGDSGVTVNTMALPDGGPPPGVGPQPLDVGTSSQDAGAEAGSAFVHRQGGLTEKDCDEIVLTFAKLQAKEKHNPAPTQADLTSDAIYSQMVVDCGASTTKKQHKCALGAHTTNAWKKCME